MKTKILISAIAMAMSGAVMATDPDKAMNQAPEGSPEVVRQGPEGGPANTQVEKLEGDPSIAQQGPEGDPAAAPSGPPEGSPEVARQGPASPEDIAAGSDFTSLDKDGDGYISKEEASADVQDRWETADRNADGKLDQSEFSALETQDAGDTMGHDKDESGRTMDKM